MLFGTSTGIGGIQVKRLVNDIQQRGLGKLCYALLRVGDGSANGVLRGNASLGECIVTGVEIFTILTAGGWAIA